MTAIVTVRSQAENSGPPVVRSFLLRDPDVHGNAAPHAPSSVLANVLQNWT